MRKLICIWILFVGVSCSLDLPIEDQITGLDAIDNIDIANESLSGVYLNFPKNKVIFSVLADDLYPNKHIATYYLGYNFYQWRPKEIILFSNTLWKNYYSTIAKANVLLSRLDVISTSIDSEQQQLNNIKSQVLSLKAFAYFELLQLYATTYSESTKNRPGIILKNSIESEELPRADLETSYQEIEKLLLKAIELATDTPKTKFRFTKKSTKVLLAKTYFNWTKYDKAIAICDEIISQHTISKEEYQSVWKNPQDSDEVLLVFENDIFNYADIYSQSFGSYFYYVNRNISYEDIDYRKDINFIPSEFRLLNNSVIQVNFLGKNQPSLDISEVKPIVAFRTAEIYFIKAESEFQLKKIAKAKATINDFLSYRKASQITADETHFLDELLKEKQKEFLGEGLRYFDIKRYKKSLQRVDYRINKPLKTIFPNDYRWLLPIPNIEIKENSNAVQNPKWETIIF